MAPLLLLAALAGVGLWLVVRRRLWSLERARAAHPSITSGTRQFEGLLLALGGLLIWLAQPLGAESARALLGLDEAASATLRGIALLSLGAYAGAGLALAIAGAAQPGLVGWRGLRPGLTDFRVGLLAFLIVTPGVMLLGSLAQLVAERLAALTGGAPPDALAHETLKLMTERVGEPWWWATAALVVVGAPIVEEVIFRRMLQGGVRGLTGSRWAAVLVATAPFVLVHAGAVPPHALATLAALSVCFGVVYERTGRIWAPIVMHALFNALNVALASAGAAA